MHADLVTPVVKHCFTESQKGNGLLVGATQDSPSGRGIAGMIFGLSTRGLFEFFWPAQTKAL
jgi:hypothetical protein